MDKQSDVMAILKLYELRRDEEMRSARKWYFSGFAPQNVMDILKLYRGGERASAYFRMVTSYWDMAASFVNNGAIDTKIFLDAGTEHIFVFSKIEPFLAEIRATFNEPDYLSQLEKLVLSIPGIEQKLENRRRLSATWTNAHQEKSTQ